MLRQKPSEPERQAREAPGESPSPNEYLQRFPDRAAELRKLLGLEMVTQPSATAAAAPALGAGWRLGGYELLEEIGRGGMGVVYRARQVALHRVVALKMILAGAHAGPEERAWFRREAEVVARLRHPHIIQIFEIGEDGELLYLSMEYVAGSLDKLLAHGRARGSVGLSPRESAGLVETLALAMQHAHEQGVVHRDLKPANILTGVELPAADEPPALAALVPRVTDFGLAKILDAGGGRTGSGAVRGTPSYMAPEQAVGRAVDARTDVYALGVILYELLTGRLSFQGENAAETLHLVRTAEPVSPGQLQPKLPRDLQTICLSCLQKEPQRRYRAAAALAEDLRRFLDGRPILARPPSAVRRALLWVKRRPATAALTASIAVTMLLALGAGMWWRLDQAARRGEAAARRQMTAEEVRRLLDRATGLRANGQPAEALAEAKHARGLLEQVEGLDELREESQRQLDDLERATRSQRLLAQVEAVRQWRPVKGDGFDPAEADAALARAFREAGADVLALSPAQVAERLDPSVRVPLSGGIAFWSGLQRPDGAAARDRLRALVQAVDPDPGRSEIRATLARRDRKALVNLAAATDVAAQAPATLEQLGEALLQLGETKAAEAFLQRAQREHPGDYWINHHLADTHFRLEHGAEAVRYSSVAVALRPNSPGAHLNLGNAHFIHEDADAAALAYERATHLDSNFAPAHYSLGLAHFKAKQLPKALAALEKASALNARHANALHYRGLVLHELLRFKEAADVFRKALALTPEEPSLYCDLGHALQRQGLFAESLASFRRGHELGRKSADWRSPSARWVAEALRLKKLDADFADVLAGKKPLSPLDQIEYGHVCYCKQMYAESARYFQTGLAAKPELGAEALAMQYGNAAYAAVRAGTETGGGAAEEKDRSAWRTQAALWLGLALTHWERRLADGTPPERAAARKMLGHWQTDYSLSAVRDPEALAALPAAERAAWAQFWNQLGKVLETGRPALTQ